MEKSTTPRATTGHNDAESTRADATDASWEAKLIGQPVVRGDSLANTAWIKHFPIIAHCHLRWDFVWQRPQQIFSRLAENHRIAYIEEPSPAVSADAAPRLEISEPQRNIVRIVPILPASASIEDECATVLVLIRNALQNHPLLAGLFERPVQWFYSPMTAPSLLGKFGAYGVVYDCMDELANFRFAPADIADRERFVLSHADVVFTGGYQLFQSKSRHHGNVHFHGCGVDVKHFGRARSARTEVLAPVAALPRPVFGYFGVIDERLDYSLIAALAERFPDASIVMAGPVVKVDQSQLPQMPNIHWLGQQAYESLPALVKGFDVCLMPFALNDATRYINPTKTLEYMAAAKPIVSTAVADVVRNFTPVVDVAGSQDEFLQAVDRAWHAPDLRLIEEGVKRAQGASWTATVSTIRSQIQDAIAGRANASDQRGEVVEESIG
ncbi:MAG: glycosyltransferase [Pseudomonadota bacterium]|nr:glycosyltransferase [Pseudomonadota bacterium]